MALDLKSQKSEHAHKGIFRYTVRNHTNGAERVL